MSEMNRRKLFTGLAVLPFAGTLLAHSSEKTILPRKFPPPLSGRERMRQRYFPNLELITQEGKKVKFYDDVLKDKIVILNMMYANCEGICPTITSNLKRVQALLNEQIRHDIFIYSLTIKPEEDTPEKLKEYAAMHGIKDKKWTFLTGKPEDMDMLRHSIGFADPNPTVDKDKSKHSGMLRYGNEPLSIWGTCQGSGKPEWIAQEVGFAIPREFKRNPRINE